MLVVLVRRISLVPPLGRQMLIPPPRSTMQQIFSTVKQSTPLVYVKCHHPRAQAGELLNSTDRLEPLGGDLGPNLKTPGYLPYAYAINSFQGVGTAAARLGLPAPQANASASETG